MPDATHQIENENMFNPKPSAGGQFAMAYIEVTNIGTEKDNFNIGDFHLEGLSGESYDQPWMIVCPNGFPTSDQFPGATMKGNIAFDVAKQAIHSVKLYYKSGLWGDKIYFDLP